MSLSLPYSFPKAPSEEPDFLLPREVQVSRNLDIGKEWVQVSPVQVSEPYVKAFAHSNIAESLAIPLKNPLDDILAESQQEIMEYSLDLPYLKIVTTTVGLPKATSKNTSIQLLNRKRSRMILELMDQRQLDNTSNACVYSGIKTPTRTPVRVLSTSSKKPKAGLRESTPTSESKDSIQLKSSLQKSDFKLSDSDDADGSINDPLACHAENIMRMAMDSTMLGSFCNNSFLSNFSNLAEDSVLGRKYPDILSDSDRSISELGQRAPTSLLAKQRAQKIEISAEELQEAVNDSIR